MPGWGGEAQPGGSGLATRWRGRLDLVRGGYEALSHGCGLDERRDLAPDEHPQEGGGDPDNGTDLTVAPVPPSECDAYRYESENNGLRRRWFFSNPRYDRGPCPFYPGASAWRLLGRERIARYCFGRHLCTSGERSPFDTTWGLWSSGLAGPYFVHESLYVLASPRSVILVRHGTDGVRYPLHVAGIQVELAQRVSVLVGDGDGC